LDSNTVLSFEELEQIRELYNQQAFINWLRVDLFSVNWWLLLIIFVVPWIIWWKIVDRKRLAEILIYGMLIGIISTLLCIIGYNLMLWGYPNRLISFLMPPLFPIVLTVLPVMYMLMYQYFQSKFAFIIASLIMSAFAAFVAEPIFVKMQMYVEYHWTHLYSFPIYFLMAVGFRKLTREIIKTQIGRPE
jgi:hypothetical protein